MIHFCVDDPNYDGVHVERHDWSNISYGNGFKDIPIDVPLLKDKGVVFSHYYDTNLMHGILFGKPVAGCFHMVNLTLIMWYLKK